MYVYAHYFKALPNKLYVLNEVGHYSCVALIITGYPELQRIININIYILKRRPGDAFFFKICQPIETLCIQIPPGWSQEIPSQQVIECLEGNEPMSLHSLRQDGAPKPSRQNSGEPGRRWRIITVTVLEGGCVVRGSCQIGSSYGLF